MTALKTVLVADDDASIRTVLTQALKREGYEVKATDNGATLFRWVVEGKGDVVITDVMMPGENGLDLIPKIHQKRPGMKVIVMSAQNALTTAVAASRKGALEYLPKPFDIDVLLKTVEQAFKPGEKPGTVHNDQTVIALNKTFVTGQSRAMQDIYRTIARLVNTDLTVLITGESGTGKEVIAQALHEYSSRKDKAFVAVNMAAIPKDLIESDLFGHEKGAFTGATQKTSGKFEQAAGGTLFLDEIGDMPFEAQTRLLRVLQEGEFTAVGGQKPIKANARIIAATNKDIRQLVAKSLFREDLYYRLNVIPLRVPSLRERREDIPALVQHFLASQKSVKVFEPEAMKALQEFKWPGNIRELENFIKRLVALSLQDVVDAKTVKAELSTVQMPVFEENFSFEMLIEKYLQDHETQPFANGLYDRLLAKLERPLIARVLGVTGGNQIKAAEILGLNRNTLRKKIRERDIDVRKQ